MHLTATEQVQCAGDYSYCFPIIEYGKIFHNSLQGRWHGFLPGLT